MQVPAVTLVHNDVLSIRDLPGELAIFLGACTGSSRLKVVANIPYNITTGMRMVLRTLGHRPLTLTWIVLVGLLQIS